MNPYLVELNHYRELCDGCSAGSLFLMTFKEVS
jgi:hypothetical protein